MAISDYTHLRLLTDDGAAALEELSAQSPVLVYFSTTWCAPCKTYGPLVDSFASAHPELAAFAADGDDSPEVTGKYGVGAFPTTILVADGRVVWRRDGDMSEQTIAAEVAVALEGAAAATPRAPGAQSSVSASGTMPAVMPPGAYVTYRFDGNARALQPGEHITVAEGAKVLLSVTADTFSPDTYPVQWLEQFPHIPISGLWLSGETIDVATVERVIALRPAEVAIDIQTPLPEDVADLLAGAGIEALRINAPGFHTEEMAARAQGVIVNGVQVTPNYRLDPAPEVPWTTTTELATQIADGDRLTVFVQRAHPADSALLAPFASHSAQHTVFVSSYRDEALNTLFPLAYVEKAALFGVEDGVIRWRAALPKDGTALSPDDLARHWESSSDGELAALPELGERVFSPTGAADYLSLTTVDGVRAGGIWIDDEAVTVPAGWRTTREVNIYPSFSDEEPEQISTSEVDELLLRIQDREPWNAGVLAASEELLSLVITANVEVQGLVDAVALFPSLRMLFADTMPEDDRAAIRAAHPDLVINGAWPE